MKWFTMRPDPGRGWGYSPGSVSTGSMTTAGLAGLGVASFHLGERPAEVEMLLASGVDWLARNFVVDANPRNDSWQYYYLYGLERAGRLLGKDFFGPYEWYRDRPRVGASGSDHAHHRPGAVGRVATEHSAGSLCAPRPVGAIPGRCDCGKGRPQPSGNNPVESPSASVGAPT